MVGSPLGQTGVSVPRAILLRGSRCRLAGHPGRDHRASRSGAGRPPLRGPVLGSFLAADEAGRRRMPGFAGGSRSRYQVPDLVDELIARTGRAMDSVLAGLLPGLELRPPRRPRLEINTLFGRGCGGRDPFRSGAGRVRFAVSLRERRITAGDDTLLAATVMAWDSAGTWQQRSFGPTLLSFVGGRLAPYGALRRSIFWRRLQPISDFGFSVITCGWSRSMWRGQRDLGNHPASRERGGRRGRSGGALPMKIYTRTGDTGETALFGGGRVPKDHPRVAAYGDVDELNSVIGVVRATEPAELFDAAARVDPAGSLLHRRAPGHARSRAGGKALEKAALSPERVSEFERVMDEAERELPPLRAFVLPAGTPKAAALHLARTVCRRAERSVVHLARDNEVPPELFWSISIGSPTCSSPSLGWRTTAPA